VGLTLITGVFGGHDFLRPLPALHGFDEAVCVTDDPTLRSEGWEFILEPPGADSRRTAKRPKMNPWLYTSSDSTVWIDASVQIHDGRFSSFTREHLTRDDFLVWEHPEERNCLYQEADYCQDWPKYAAEPIREQTAAYRSSGMPEGFGLWAAGTVGMNRTDKVVEFATSWIQQNSVWSYQDQISLPYLVWMTGFPVATWDAHELNNDMITFHQHSRSD